VGITERVGAFGHCRAPRIFASAADVSQTRTGTSARGPSPDSFQRRSEWRERPGISQFVEQLIIVMIAIITTASGANGQKTTGLHAPEIVADTGLASFYAACLTGKRTASGERLRNNQLVAAHPTLPLGTVVRVTNLDNNRSVEVRIVDRGPGRSRVARGYIIDLSREAARALRFRRAGKAHVRVEIIRAAPTR
jgi:rare lipoprotein A